MSLRRRDSRVWSFPTQPQSRFVLSGTSSAAFQRFRGEDWMQEPCRSCERKTLDFGGCRCQAMLLASDAAATDPVCSLSPKRSLVDDLIKGAAMKESHGSQWVYRVDPAR